MNSVTPRRSMVAPLAAAACATLLATAAHAGLVQFTAPGGEWNAASNWDAGNVPTANDTVYFGYKMTAEPATITLTEDAEAKNIAGDANGPQPLTLDLGGNTLKLYNESDVKSPLTLVNGTVAVTNHLIVHPDATLTVGEDATLKATGISNQVEVKGGGTLDLTGGRVESMSGLRDLAVSSNGTLVIRHGGTLAARAADLGEGSTLHVVLDDEGFEFAPLEVQKDVTTLGKLEVSLADGFTPEPGRKYLLIQYGGEVKDEFDNAPQGGTVKARGGTPFTVDYQDGGTVSLTAAGGADEPQ